MKQYLDASVVVKWFKEKEDYRKESLVIRDQVISFESEFVMSHYGLLEVVRALVKNDFPKDVIEDSFQSLYDLYEIGALMTVDLNEVLFLAKEIEIELNLYASDAVHVASAIHKDCDIFWSVDDHHLKDKTKEFLREYDMKSKHLSEIDS
ncbi:MAG: type II toxin-antitoxin system VapC family toxin [Thermoplasmatota archaeon]